MIGLREAKRAARGQARAVRSRIPEEERAGRSLEICRRIERSGLLDGLERVMVYAPVRGEVDILPLAEALLARGVAVAFPLVLAGEGRMVPVIVRALDELAPGAYGIPEPPASGERLSPEDLDAVVVPAVAYDREGYRLGYGGGYYDRFLPSMRRRAVRIGAVFHDLLWDALPREPFDQRVDWVFSEMETLGPFRNVPSLPAGGGG